MSRRLAEFIAGGAVGFVLQITALALLTMVVGWPYVPATAIAVELAVIHNFWWHERRTFSDRRARALQTTVRLLKYHLTAGILSIAANVVLTAIAVERFRLPTVAANAAAVVMMTAANFIAADRWVFTQKTVVTVAALLSMWPSLLVAGAPHPEPEAIAAWNHYIEQTEAHLHESASSTPQGATVHIHEASIHHWRGSTVARHTTVDRVLQALMHPGTPPPQEDVLESRVLSRSGDSLHLYLKLVRRAIVMVVYDTEHDVTFRRLSPDLATSRSISTRIVETGGGDRGFLWRLNSYWRYTQVGGNVRIDVESVSLSRDVPRLAQPVAGPLIARVARESLSRTLDSLRRYLESQPPTAVTSTPATASPSRSLAAIASAPGVSP